MRYEVRRIFTDEGDVLVAVVKGEVLSPAEIDQIIEASRDPTDQIIEAADPGDGEPYPRP